MKDFAKSTNWFGWIFFNKNIPLISPILIKIRQRKLRKIIRGYRILEDKYKKFPLLALREALNEKIFNEKSNYYSPLIFNNSINNSKLICKHFFLKILFTRKAYFPSLNIEILYSIGNKSKLIYPLPRIYRVYLEDQNISINHFLSDILWIFYQLVFFFYGVIFGLKYIFVNLYYLIFNKRKLSLFKSQEFIYFNNLSKDSLPTYEETSLKSNFINWYIENNRFQCPEIITHNLEDVKEFKFKSKRILFKSYLEKFDSFNNLFNFLIWFLSSTSLCILDLFRGRWWHLLLFYEALIASIIKFQNKDKIARDYFFHNSNFIYRPMWTYEAEKKGSNINLFFYSTNYTRIHNKENIDDNFVHYYIRESMWPNYYVWDKYDKEYFEKNILNTPNFIIAKSISIENGVRCNINKDKKNLFIFDVQPYREIFTTTWLNVYDQYAYDAINAIKFLKDIVTASEDLNIKLYVKRKRNIGSLAHPAYLKILNKLYHNKKISLVDPKVNATNMIEKSNAVISMPFTSTAHIAKELNIPSIFYDSSGLVKTDILQTHNIKFISDTNSLKKWLIMVFNN